MNSRLIGALVVATALCAWSVPAPAQQDQGSFNQQARQQFQDRGPSGQQQAASRGQASGQRQVTGQISSLDTVTDPQTGQRIVVAEVRTSGGKTMPVDLGSPRFVDQMDLEEGQQITVAGRRGQVNGQPGLVASRIEDETGLAMQVVRIAPYGRGAQRQAGQWQGQQGNGGSAGWQGESTWQTRQQEAGAAGEPSWQTRQGQDQQAWLQGRGMGGTQGQAAGPQGHMAGLMVIGRLMDTRELQVQGQPQPFLLAKIRTPQGEAVVANLGPRNRLPQNVNLRTGELVAVTGELGRIDNRPVIVAHTFANVVDLSSQWSSMQGQQGQAGMENQDEDED